jgi:hypothetical protein
MKIYNKNPLRYLTPPIIQSDRSAALRCILMFLLLGQAIAQSSFGSPIVEMRVDIRPETHAISPWIYGINGLYEARETPNRQPACTLVRLGGNRTTALNWVNNASNAGHDWYNQNDSFFGKPDEGPAAAARKILDYTQERGMAAVITIPIIGYVAADHGPGGDVINSGPKWLETRFNKSVAAKRRPFSLNPDPNHRIVYQDEFVNWLRVNYPEGFVGPTKPIIFALDNEVDLWAHTHARLRGITIPHGEKVPKEVERKGKVGYKEIVDLNIEYARAIKAVIPTAKVMGPVVWNWVGIKDLSGASDGDGRHFAEYYLKKMARAERLHRRRLIDVFTFNHYSAVNVKIGDENISVTSNDTSPEVVAARLQAPRSFWDPDYIENSWLSGGKPLRIFPAVRELIEENYPGTHMAITEYNFGARHHISGGLAQADFLGILGREQVSIASWWSLGKEGFFALGAFDLYRNFDGKGGKFGNRSVHATTSDLERTSIYAAADTERNGAMTLVVINKSPELTIARIDLSATRTADSAAVWMLTEESPTPVASPALEIDQDRIITFPMPPFSASLLDIEAPRARKP